MGKNVGGKKGEEGEEKVKGKKREGDKGEKVGGKKGEG